MLDYAPGFTLYQRTSSLNQADQNLSANFQYRLSPNLTATVAEGFQKTSNYLQPTQSVVSHDRSRVLCPSLISRSFRRLRT